MEKTDKLIRNIIGTVLIVLAVFIIYSRVSLNISERKYDTLKIDSVLKVCDSLELENKLLQCEIAFETKKKDSLEFVLDSAFSKIIELSKSKVTEQDRKKAKLWIDQYNSNLSGQ